jgi:NADH-quinone oxidoreductase subunit N
VEFSVGHIVDSLWLAAPILTLLAAGLIVLVADLVLPSEHRGALGFITIAGLVLAFVAHQLVGAPGEGDDGRTFMGALTQGYLPFLAQSVILGGGIFIALISPGYIERRELPHGEYYALFLFGTTAMLALAASTELLTLFLNIELLSITFYILAGLEKHNLRSTEAAFKYFLLGSFAGAFLLLGIAFVFGATGEMQYDAIRRVIAAGEIKQPLFLTVGLILMIVGFGFKLTLAPFHMYAPDVYEGSPTPVAAAIATISKIAALAAFFPLMVLASGWAEMPRGVWAALYAVSVASMVIGNVGAVVQPNMKRMLAYSSVAHSGYAIVPMVALLGTRNPSPELIDSARGALAYYLLAYTTMTLLAFGVAASLGPKGETKIANYAGLARRNFGLGMVMLLAMLSLLGFPGTVGFYGKLQIFMVAVVAHHIPLAIILGVTSVASAYYYLRVVVTIFMQEPAGEVETPAHETLEGTNYLALGVASACIFVFAFLPSWYLF